MPKTISVITPVFNEEAGVEDCHAAIKALFEGPLAGYRREHIFADNASSDRTPEVLRRLAARDPNVRVIFNSRNYGPSRSTFNALLASSGDAVVVLFPVDLQDPAAVIADFVGKWEEGHEVVYGIRATREEGPLIKRVRGGYYRLVSRIADIAVPPNVGDFQLIDRKVVEALRRFRESYPYIRGMIANCGFKAVGVPYAWVARKKGFSKNNLYTLIDQGLNGLISLSNIPLRLCMMAGLAIAGLSVLYALATLIANLVYFREFSQPGIATLIISLFFFSGVQLFFLGVLGEYIGAIHGQVRGGPMVIERERINFAPESGAT